MEEQLNSILSNIDTAKKAKSEIDSNISTWLDEYNGEPYGNERNGRSKIVVKDIKKAVEWFLPNAIEPFVGKNRIVSLEGVTADDVDTAKMHEMLLNYQFVRNFNRYDFVHDMFKVGATEGTTVIRIGWEYEEDVTETEYKNVSLEEFSIMVQQGAEISGQEQNEDGTVNFTVTETKVLENRPTAYIVRNGDFGIDPTATTVEEADYCYHRYDETLYTLQQDESLDQNVVAELMQGVEQDSEVENRRNESSRQYGYDADAKNSIDKNGKITVYDYFGNLEIDGEMQPAYAVIANGKLLKLEANPFPDKEKPFVMVQFSRTPFQAWGKPLAELLSDNQKVRTSIMRGVIDSLANSNNGRKFAKKGAFDAQNKKRLNDNIDGLIEFNERYDANDFFDGTYNQIPQTVMGIYETVQVESESLSGITRYSQGVGGGELNKTATGVATITNMSQKRMMEIIRRYSEDGLKEVFRKWIEYNKEFLTDKEVMRIAGRHIEFRNDDIQGRFDIDITVGTDNLSESRINSIVTLMQQVGGLGQVASVPPEFFNMMLAKMADEMNMPDVAEMMKTYQAPPPSEEQIMAQQLELKAKETDIELDKAKTIETMSKANKNNVDAKIEASGLREKVQ